MAFASVQFGLYYGFSLAEMQAELARYKAAVQAVTGGAGHVVSASVNGSSFTYGPNADLSLAQWQAEIQNAMADVDDNVIGLPSETVAAFNR
jgi:hypothetical protein